MQCITAKAQNVIITSIVTNILYISLKQHNIFAPQMWSETLSMIATAGITTVQPQWHNEALSWRFSEWEQFLSSFSSLCVFSKFWWSTTHLTWLGLKRLFSLKTDQWGWNVWRHSSGPHFIIVKDGKSVRWRITPLWMESINLTVM